MRSVQQIHEVGIPETKNPVRKKAVTRYLLAALYVLPVMTYTTGILQIVATAGILLILLALFFYDEFYLALPILIFFYMQLILPGGIVLFRIYSLLLILKVLKKPIPLDRGALLPFLVIMLYCVIWIFPQSSRWCHMRSIRAWNSPPSRPCSFMPENR